jgi:hypothetical protein
VAPKKQEPTGKAVALMLGVFAPGFGWCSLSTDDGEKPTSEVVTNPAEKIDSLAVVPMDEQSWPKLYKAWGAAGVQRLNQLQPRVAVKVAESPKCDQVQAVGYSEKRSTPKVNPVFYVECRNGQRFYITETELAQQAPPQSEQERMAIVSDADVIILCEKLVKVQLQRPASYDRKVFSTSVTRDERTGGIRVEFPFTAATGLGIPVPQNARCLFTPNGEPEVTISD